MKKLLGILIATAALSAVAADAPAASAPAPAASAAQKVCVDKLGKDGKPVMGKDGKPAQECKEMKVHKKLEGTKVPEKK